MLVGTCISTVVFEVSGDLLLLRLHSPSHRVPLSPFPGNFVVSEWGETGLYSYRRVDRLHDRMQNYLASILTLVYLICKCLQCPGLRGHRDSGHIAKSIWIITLGEKTKQRSACTPGIQCDHMKVQL